MSNNYKTAKSSYGTSIQWNDTEPLVLTSISSQGEVTGTRFILTAVITTEPGKICKANTSRH